MYDGTLVKDVYPGGSVCWPLSKSVAKGEWTLCGQQRPGRCRRGRVPEFQAYVAPCSLPPCRPRVLHRVPLVWGLYFPHPSSQEAPDQGRSQFRADDAHFSPESPQKKSPRWLLS